MKKLSCLFALVSIAMGISAQETIKKIDFNIDNQTIYTITIGNMSSDNSAFEIDYLLNKMDEIYFCKTDGKSGNCSFIADNNVDIDKITSKITASGHSVSLNLREKLTKEKYLHLYIGKNGHPVLINTRNPEKDNRNYELAVSIIDEKN